MEMLFSSWRNQCLYHKLHFTNAPFFLSTRVSSVRLTHNHNQIIAGSRDRPMKDRKSRRNNWYHGWIQLKSAEPQVLASSFACPRSASFGLSKSRRQRRMTEVCKQKWLRFRQIVRRRTSQKKKTQAHTRWYHHLSENVTSTPASIPCSCVHVLIGKELIVKFFIIKCRSTHWR